MRRALSLRLLLAPDRDEMEPLIEMAADHRFKLFHDFLGQICPRLPSSKSSSLVADLGKEFHRVTFANPRNTHWKKRATGRAGKFRRGKGGGETMPKQFHCYGCLSNRSIDEQCDRGSTFQPADNFDKSER